MHEACAIERVACVHLRMQARGGATVSWRSTTPPDQMHAHAATEGGRETREIE